MTETLTLKNRQYYPRFGVRQAGAPEDRTLTFTFMTESVALDDGVLIADGMDAARFLSSPTFFLDHCTDVEHKAGVVTAIRQTATGWEGDFKFAPADISPEADQAYRFLTWSGHGACSIGFVVTEMDRDPLPEDRAKYGLPRYGWIGRKWQLLEISIVGVGADPGAIMHSGGAKARAVRAAFAEAALDRWLREGAAETKTMAVVEESLTTQPDAARDAASDAMPADVQADAADGGATLDEVLGAVLDLTALVEDMASKMSSGQSAHGVEATKAVDNRDWWASVLAGLK